jgi:hypothetical protein
VLVKPSLPTAQCTYYYKIGKVLDCFSLAIDRRFQESNYASLATQYAEIWRVQGTSIFHEVSIIKCSFDDLGDLFRRLRKHSTGMRKGWGKLMNSSAHEMQTLNWKTELALWICHTSCSDRIPNRVWHSGVSPIVSLFRSLNIPLGRPEACDKLLPRC